MKHTLNFWISRFLCTAILDCQILISTLNFKSQDDNKASHAVVYILLAVDLFAKMAQVLIMVNRNDSTLLIFELVQSAALTVIAYGYSEQVQTILCVLLAMMTHSNLLADRVQKAWMRCIPLRFSVLIVGIWGMAQGEIHQMQFEGGVVDCSFMVALSLIGVIQIDKKDQPIDTPPRLQAQSSEILAEKSPNIYQELPIVQNWDNESYITEDERVLQYYQWIKRLQFIVMDREFNIVVQTFSVVDIYKFYSRSIMNATESEQFQSILSYDIISCNRSTFMLFEQLDQQEEEIFYLGKGVSINDVLGCLIRDQESHKQSCFEVYKLDAPSLELQNTKFIIFLSTHMGKPFLFIQFIPKEKVSLPPSQKAIQRLFRTLQQPYCEQLAIHLNCITTLSSIAEFDTQFDQLYFDRYICPIRISSIQLYLSIANLRDYNLFLQNQLMLKISNFKIEEAIEDVLLLFNETCLAKQIQIEICSDIPEQSQVIQSDIDRLKQIVYIYLKRQIQHTIGGKIIIDIYPNGPTLIGIIMRDNGQGMDEKELKTLTNHINKYAFSPSAAYQEINNRGFSEHSDLVVAQILSKKLSGTFKRGTEIVSDRVKGSQYIFSIEAYQQNLLDFNADSNPMKVLPGQKYFETSLSFILAGQQSELHDGVQSKYQESNHRTLTHDKSLQFSLSQISRQLSFKPSPTIENQQSVYFSQISRIKGQDSQYSRINANSNYSRQISNHVVSNFQAAQPSLIQVTNPNVSSTSKVVQVPSRIAQSEENNDNSISQRKSSQHTIKYFSQLRVEPIEEYEEHTFQSKQQSPQKKHVSQLHPSMEQFNHQQYFTMGQLKPWMGSNNQQESMIDFGPESVLSVKVPESQEPKLQRNIVKYKITSTCCTKVLIASDDYTTMHMLELILQFYSISADRVFNFDHAIKKLEQKPSCHCGNSGYLLYFIALSLPPKGGFQLSRALKERVVEQLMDKAFIIGTTGLIDFNIKAECYKNGMDHYLSLPIDLHEMQSIIRHFSFD